MKKISFEEPMLIPNLDSAALKRSEPKTGPCEVVSTRAEALKCLKSGHLSKGLNNKARLYSQVKELSKTQIPGWSWNSYTKALEDRGLDMERGQSQTVLDEFKEESLSPVLLEDFSAPPSSILEKECMMFETEEFFQFLLSDEWPGKVSLRLIGGKLLDYVIRALIVMEKSWDILEHRTFHAFLQNRIPNPDYKETPQGHEGKGNVKLKNGPPQWIFDTLHVTLVYYNSIQKQNSDDIESLQSMDSYRPLKKSFDAFDKIIGLPDSELICIKDRMSQLTNEKAELLAVEQEVLKEKQNLNSASKSKLLKESPKLKKLKEKTSEMKLDDKKPGKQIMIRQASIDINDTCVEWIDDISVTFDNSKARKQHESTSDLNKKDKKTETSQADLHKHPQTHAKRTHSKSLSNVRKESSVAQNASFNDMDNKRSARQNRESVLSRNVSVKTSLTNHNDIAVSNYDNIIEEESREVYESLPKKSLTLRSVGSTQFTEMTKANNPDSKIQQSVRGPSITQTFTGISGNSGPMKASTTCLPQSELLKNKRPFTAVSYLKEDVYVKHKELHVSGMYQPNQRNQISTENKLKQRNGKNKQLAKDKTEQLNNDYKKTIENEPKKGFKCLYKENPKKNVIPKTGKVDEIKHSTGVNGWASFLQEEENCQIEGMLVNQQEKRILKAIAQPQPQPRIPSVKQSEITLRKNKGNKNQNTSNQTDVDVNSSRNRTEDSNTNKKQINSEIKLHFQKYETRFLSNWYSFNEHLLSWRDHLDRGLNLTMENNKIFKMQNIWIDKNDTSNDLEQDSEIDWNTNSLTLMSAVENSRSIREPVENVTHLSVNGDGSAINNVSKYEKQQNRKVMEAECPNSISQKVSGSQQFEEISLNKNVNSSDPTQIQEEYFKQSRIHNEEDRKQFASYLKKYSLFNTNSDLINLRSADSNPLVLMPECEDTYPATLGRLRKNYNFLRPKSSKSALQIINESKKLSVSIEDRSINDDDFGNNLNEQTKIIARLLLSAMKCLVIRKEISTNSSGNTFTTITFSRPEIFKEMMFPF